MRCLWAVLPAAILWGASFPLALAAVGRDEKDPGGSVGTVYAANTVGGIIGALFGSLLIIAWLGTQDAQRILIALAAISAIVALVPSRRSGASKKQPSDVARTGCGRRRGGRSRCCASCRCRRFRRCSSAMAAGSRIALANENDFIYMGEGMISSVAVSQLSNGVLNYHNAGKVQASSEPQDMRLQRMLGHLTTLLPPQPNSVLVIGCGAGVTAGAVSIDPALESETIAEIEPLVPKVVSKYFGAHNYNVVDESEGARRDRRRAPLHSHDGSEVRRGDVRSARSVGQGRGDALHEGILRGREGAPQCRAAS